MPTQPWAVPPLEKCCQQFSMTSWGSFAFQTLVRFPRFCCQSLTLLGNPAMQEQISQASLVSISFLLIFPNHSKGFWSGVPLSFIGGVLPASCLLAFLYLFQETVLRTLSLPIQELRIRSRQLNYQPRLTRALSSVTV